MNKSGRFLQPVEPRDMLPWSCSGHKDTDLCDKVNRSIPKTHQSTENGVKQKNHPNNTAGRESCVTLSQPATKMQPLAPTSTAAVDNTPCRPSKQADDVECGYSEQSLQLERVSKACESLICDQNKPLQHVPTVYPQQSALKWQQLPCKEQLAGIQKQNRSPDVPHNVCPRNSGAAPVQFPQQSKISEASPKSLTSPNGLQRNPGYRLQRQSFEGPPQAFPCRRPPLQVRYRLAKPYTCPVRPPQLPQPIVFPRPSLIAQNTQHRTSQRPPLPPQNVLPQPGISTDQSWQPKTTMPLPCTQEGQYLQAHNRLPKPDLQRPVSQPLNRLPPPRLCHIPVSQSGASFLPVGLNQIPPAPLTRYRFPLPGANHKPQEPPPAKADSLVDPGYVPCAPARSQLVCAGPTKQLDITETESVEVSRRPEGGKSPIVLFSDVDKDDRCIPGIGELMFGDIDERIFKQRDPMLKLSPFDQESFWKWKISPERRTNFSFDGSCVSDTLSVRTDTDSNPRDTPVSWESQSQNRNILEVGSITESSHRQNVMGHDRDITNISDTVSSKDLSWEGELEENQQSVEHHYHSSNRLNGKEGFCDDWEQQDNYSYDLGYGSSDWFSSQDASWDDDNQTSCKRLRDDPFSSDLDWDRYERMWRIGKRLRIERELKAQMESESIDKAAEENTPSWTRSCPADLYFIRTDEGTLEASQKMIDLENRFEEEIVKRAKKAQSSAPATDIPTPPARQPCKHFIHHHHKDSGSDSSSSDSSPSESDSEEGGATCCKWMEEMDHKRSHPLSLHPELWYNDAGEMNNGPLCRCSLKARRNGIRHGIYPGEKFIQPCDPATNNIKDLHHYRITMSPSTNFLTNNPTIIEFDNHEFIFEGFSLFTHERLDNVPLCKVVRFHIEYTVHFIEEQVPESFTIRSLDLITQFLFREILELVDMKWTGIDGGCSPFHVMPRFARSLPENGKEILSMNEVLKFLLKSSRPLVSDNDLPVIKKFDKEEWQAWVDLVSGMIVTYPGKKPSSIRLDQLDRTKLLEDDNSHPILVHFGIRPAQLSYAGDPVYQKTWKHYIKLKHLLNSKPKISNEEKMKLKVKEAQLQELQRKSSMKREVTVELSSQGFMRTGLRPDIFQHALLLPVLLSHIRFHSCLNVLEDNLVYTFQDRNLLQLALTHTSFRSNYGTNPAHARNSLTNCGLRQVEYGDRHVYYQNTRKRGINILVDIMSRMGKKEETPSEIPHNERLEFLGDAVVEFLTSVHLFYMFPWLEEGGLSTYRTAIVQNQHLAILAEKLHLQNFMLFVHGPDLCHESDLRHAMANCFEALMGALFLDGGLDVVDEVFGRTLFGDDPTILKTWMNLPLHPLQEDEPGDDRHWVESSPALQKLVGFEERTGVTFTHIRLLAKAFTHRNVGYNFLTMGHNQRLEFLGDTVLQLIASEYLYKHFPEHHEGHLSLLRSSLVNSRTQSIVCEDLGMMDFVIYSTAGSDKFDMKTKQKADLLESFLGALYVDSGMDFCKTFCDVCFFPRLKDFILNQDWNDPKSQLQQCCLTLRRMGGGEPDIPIYKVIESLGPSNTRKYIVAVYFRGERLATGTGHSIQQAEMSGATNALRMRTELFPILQHQRRFLERRYRGREWNYKPYQYRPHHQGNSHRGPSTAPSLPSSTVSSSCHSASSSIHW